jgi:hypothetical protein
MNPKMVQELVKNGWIFTPHSFNSVYDILKFGEYNLSADTSSWLMLYCGSRHIRDIFNPGDYEAGWMANLIIYIVDMDSRLVRSEKIDKIIDNETKI